MKRAICFSTFVTLALLTTNAFASGKGEILESVLKNYSKRRPYLSKADIESLSRQSNSSPAGLKTATFPRTPQLPFQRRISIGSRTIDMKTPFVFQRHISDDGAVSTTSFDLRNDALNPHFGLSDSHLEWKTDAGEAVRVERTYKRNGPNGKPNNIVASDNIAVTKVNGEYYRTVHFTDVVNGRNTYHAHIEDKDWRAIRVGISKKDYRKSFKGELKVPEHIKGKVIEIRISNDGTRLSFSTTEGEAYKFSIDRGQNGEAVFKQVAKGPIDGGLKSLIAEVKSIPAALPADTATRGVTLELSRFAR